MLITTVRVLFLRKDSCTVQIHMGHRSLFLLALLLFVAGNSYAQSMWGTLFSEDKSKELESAYQDVTGAEQQIPFESLKNYVKTLNDYALLHFQELNDEFQKKIVSRLVNTDSMDFYNNQKSYDWWQKKFLQLSEIMPVFVIQKQVGKFNKPIDTLEIKVPGTDKVISVIVNNEIIKGYLFSRQPDSLLAEQDLRHLYSNDVYDLIAFYRTGRIPKRSAETTRILAKDTIKKETFVADAPDTKSNDVDNADRKEFASQKEPETSDEKSESKQIPPADLSKGIAYRIQIAAARNPLSGDELNARYQGDRSKKQFREEGWIKYYVAETPTLDKARNILQEKGMPRDAFIMAYKNGQKAPEYLRKTFGKSSSGFRDLAPLTYNGKIWVVQIAADQKPLEVKDINSRYSGNKPVYYINEGVWHRYSIGVFDSFQSADGLRKTCGVSDAFVAAYLNGHRLDSWTGRQEKLSDDPIKYIVQVAASFKKLPDAELKERYRGDSTVIYFQENGYHKYAIGYYKTFKKAIEAKEGCGVPDAFIKAYQGDKKVSLFKAKNITD